MDYKIHNFAPDSDIIEVVFYGSERNNNRDKIVVTIDRDACGTVKVSLLEKLEGTDSRTICRMVLGQAGFTDKL